MKFTPLALAAIVATTSTVFAAESPLKDQKDKVGYSIGVDIGTTLKRQGIEIDPAKVALGLKDAYSGGKIALNEAEMKSTMESFQKEMMAKMAKKRDEDSKKHKESGEKFLTENKAKEGVKVTASGLQYKVITEGKGEKPKTTDIVVTNYRGTTIDGKEFDSSYKRNEPAEFPLAGVIPGWTEGLQLMPAGSKYQFYIPAELAYGDNAPPEIGPGQTLIFDVELLSIKPPAAPPSEEAPADKAAAANDGPATSGESAPKPEEPATEKKDSK